MDWSYTPPEPDFGYTIPSYSPPVQYAASSGTGVMDFLNSAVNAASQIASSIAQNARTVGNAVGTVQAAGDIYQQAQSDAIAEARRTQPAPAFVWGPVQIALAAGVAFIVIKALQK